MTSPSSTTNPKSAEQVVRAKRFIVSRVVSDQALILDTAQDEIRQLNEVGSFIWSLILKSESTRDDMVIAIIDHFEVSSAIAASDLDHFLCELNNAGLIEFTDRL